MYLRRSRDSNKGLQLRVMSKSGGRNSASCVFFYLQRTTKRSQHCRCRNSEQVVHTRQFDFVRWRKRRHLLASNRFVFPLRTERDLLIAVAVWIRRVWVFFLLCTQYKDWTKFRNGRGRYVACFKLVRLRLGQAESRWSFGRFRLWVCRCRRGI